MQRVLVYGGCGALGATTIKALRSASCFTISVDIAANADSSVSIVVPSSKNYEEQAHFVVEEVSKALSGEKLDAVLCVAGGWAGGKISSKSVFSATQGMYSASVQTSVLSGHIAAHYMKTGGLLVLPGAAGALGPAPGMIGYALAKSAVHHLVKDLAVHDSGLPEGSTVVGICPVILDTPANRAGMPDAHFDNWTPLSTVSEAMIDWMNGRNKPASGSLIEIVTKDKVTSFENAHASA